MWETQGKQLPWQWMVETAPEMVSFMAAGVFDFLGEKTCDPGYSNLKGIPS